MQNEATKMNKSQPVLFSGGEGAEDLLYEFLKNRSPLTERAYRRDLRALTESDSFCAEAAEAAKLRHEVQS